MTPKIAYAEAPISVETASMSPETAWAKAMSYEHRPHPYPFFDELRKTPVVHVGKGAYVVTGYRELMTLAHDPRIRSDIRRLKARASGAEGHAVSAHGEHGTMITSDPLEHDKMRRQAMRHFGPPHTPDLIHGRCEADAGNGDPDLAGAPLQSDGEVMVRPSIKSVRPLLHSDELEIKASTL